MSFGERLQALRRTHKLTQEEFAQQLKVTRQAVSKWESSKGYPEIEKILYICTRYGVSMDELFADELPPRQPAAPAPREKEAMEHQPLKRAFGNFLPTCPPGIGSCCSPPSDWWSCWWPFCSVSSP